MKKIVLTFGLIAGAVMSAMMLITLPFHDAIGFDNGMIVGYTTMLIAFLLIYFGVRSYRDNVAGGRVGFWRALGVAGMIGLVASLCYVATWEVVWYTTHPDILEKYQAHEVEKARAEGKNAAEIAVMQKEMDEFAVMYNNPLANAAFTLMEPLPVAVIVSLVSAFAVSRRKKIVVGDAGVMAGARPTA